MTRDDALLIARRIMDRVETDRAIHLDAIADEIVAGVNIANVKSHCAMNLEADAAMLRLMSAKTLGEMVEITSDYFSKE